MTPRFLIGSGAIGIAATTAAEVLTAPYSAHVAAYALNPAVHLLKVVAILVFAAGMFTFVARNRRALGRVGSVAAGALGIATLAAALPYSVVEGTLDGSLAPAAANAELDAAYAAQPWIGDVAGMMLPVVLLSIVAFSVVALRRRFFAAWAPIVSLAAIPVAIAAAVLAEATGLPLPHPPAWLFLGIAAYGTAPLSPERTASAQATMKGVTP